MTPMFVETLSSQGPESVAASQSGAMKGKLRATQTSLEFSQTQTQGTAVFQFTHLQRNKVPVKMLSFIFEYADYHSCAFPRSTYCI